MSISQSVNQSINLDLFFFKFVSQDDLTRVRTELEAAQRRLRDAKTSSPAPAVASIASPRSRIQKQSSASSANCSAGTEPTPRLSELALQIIAHEAAEADKLRQDLEATKAMLTAREKEIK